VYIAPVAPAHLAPILFPSVHYSPFRYALVQVPRSRSTSLCFTAVRFRIHGSDGHVGDGQGGDDDVPIDEHVGDEYDEHE
jgi:hypothetical protein